MSNKIEILSKTSKIQMKLPLYETICHVYNVHAAYNRLIIDFICDLQLFKPINRNYFDIANSLITIPGSINYEQPFQQVSNGVC